MLDTKLLNPAAQNQPVKILIAEACLAEPVGEKMRHVDIGEEITVSRRDARLLTNMGRAFYVDRPDDHTTDRQLSVSPEVKRTIDLRVRMIREEHERRAERAARSVVTLSPALVAAVAAALAAGNSN